MNQIEFKYLNMGDKFIFKGQEYLKTNHNRGYHYQDGRIVYKSFKKLTMIQTEQYRFEVDEVKDK